MTSFAIRLCSDYDTLNTTEKKIADYLLSSPEQIFHLPIAKLASISGVSQAAWVRFAQKMGFAGIKGLKKHLFDEMNVSNPVEDVSFFSDIRDYPDILSLAKATKSTTLQAIEGTSELLNFDTIEKISSAIVKAHAIYIFGFGASATVAEDFQSKLNRIGVPAFFTPDFHRQLACSGNMTTDDIGFYISNSGKTRELLELQKTAKDRGATTISLTQQGQNALAKRSDLQLFTFSPEIYHRSGATSSRIAQLYVIDILFTSLASQNYSNIVDKLQNSHNACITHKEK